MEISRWSASPLGKVQFQKHRTSRSALHLQKARCIGCKFYSLGFDFGHLDLGTLSFVFSPNTQLLGAPLQVPPSLQGGAEQQPYPSPGLSLCSGPLTAAS